MRIFSASHLLLGPEGWLEEGGLLVEGGRIRRVLRSRAAVRRASREHGARETRVEDGLLMPGLVNAHAHLEYSGLAGKLPRTRGFLPWIEAIVAWRREVEPERIREDLLAGARRCLETGTTCVGDNDSSGAASAVGGGSGLRLRVYRELLDARDPSRTAQVLARVRRPLARRSLRAEGVAPHAPHTASCELLCAARALMRRRAIPASVHWAETPEEGLWLERGSGPWGELLEHSPRRRGLELLAEAGLLGRRTSLVHGNHPARGEPARLAAAGSVLVHCAGTHAFFGREPFPWRRYERAGVTTALGTDSLASNDDLDLRREMRLVREAAPWLSPRRVLGMATTDAARALDMAGRVGELRPGAAADLLALRLEARDPAAALDELTLGGGEVAAVWVAGRLRFAGAPAVHWAGAQQGSRRGRSPDAQG